jgi:Flp pilus assembly protein TadD
MVLEEMGRLDEAFAYFKRHGELVFGKPRSGPSEPATKPNNAAFFSAAQAAFQDALKFHQTGKLAEAEKLYRQVLAAQPGDAQVSFGYAQAHSNLGYLLLQQDRLDEAEAALRSAVAIRPDYAQAYCNLAAVLGKQERLDEAAFCCQKAIAVEPNHAEAHNNLGYIFQKQGRLREAESHFRKAVALKPEFLEAHQHLAVLLCESNRLTEGFQIFAEVAQLKRPAGLETVNSHQQRHDREQQAWLESNGRNSALGDGGRIAGAAVNPLNRVAEISQVWRTAKPQIVVINDLLTPEALEKLRRYCLDSTVWRKAYDGGYLGAFPEHGFAPPLLAQIAEELRAVYPAIIENYPLLHFWGFKYDSSLQGIKKHADFAAVNVNFWITPDEANLDPDHGGLVVWDVAAPPNWDFVRYNSAEVDILAHLEREKAKPVTIPYRANRAVIFDSDLFHETDIIRFKPGYENRRINVTLLFGRRHKQRANDHA